MFFKKIFFCAFLFCVISCSDLRFVYDDSNKKMQSLYESTLISISGDDSATINIYLQDKLGTSGNWASYRLNIQSKKDITAAVVDKDATASKFQIKNTIFYSLNNIKKECNIISEEIETITSYNTKSEGYSFGSDLSENELIEKNLKSNIDMFFNNVILSDISFVCKNED